MIFTKLSPQVSDLIDNVIDKASTKMYQSLIVEQKYDIDMLLLVLNQLDKDSDILIDTFSS